MNGHGPVAADAGVLFYDSAGEGGVSELNWPAVEGAERYEVTLLRGSDDTDGNATAVLEADQTTLQIPTPTRSAEGTAYEITALRDAVPITRYVALDAKTAGKPVDMTKYIQGLRKWRDLTPTVTEGTRVEGAAVTTTEQDQGKTVMVTRQKWVKSKVPEYVVLFQVNEALWPGSLVQGQAAIRGELLGLPISDRTPVTISTDLTGLPKSRATDLQPSAGAVREGISSMVRGQKPVAGKMKYDMTEAASLEAGLLEAGISAKYLGLSGKASVEGQLKRDEKMIVACFLQTAYSMDLDRFAKDQPSAWFTPGFTDDKLAYLEREGMIGRQNPPLYVSSVSYGRSLIFSLTTKHDITKAKAALQVSYDKGFASVEASVKAEYEKIMSESTLSILVKGGDPDTIMKMIKAGKLNEYFATAPTLEQYTPISYTLRTLDTGDLAKLGETAEFFTTTRKPMGSGPVRVHPRELNLKRMTNSGQSLSVPDKLKLSIPSQPDIPATGSNGIFTFPANASWTWTPPSGDGSPQFSVSATDDNGKPVISNATVGVSRQELAEGKSLQKSLDGSDGQGNIIEGSLQFDITPI